MSGLLHEIDAKITVRGRQRRVTFPHKLFMDYLAAWYICRFTQNIEESLKQAFPTWDDVQKHEEVVRACCGLMEGREEVIMHVISVLKVRLSTTHVNSYYFTASSLQNECRIQNPLFVQYPACGHPLSQVLNTAKLVVIEDLTGEEYDDALPCNADIVIDTHIFEYEENVTALVNSGVTRTLQRHRDHIIAIKQFSGSQDVMKQISPLLPSSSLGRLDMQHCYLPKELVNSVAEMPQLQHLTMYKSEPSHGDLLLVAIKAWHGHSQLQVLNVGYNFLPVSVCRPLLVAIAANCRHLEVLDMERNTLSGCLAGFLQNPPPALRVLYLDHTHLQAEDMESMAAAVSAGKLRHLECLDLSYNQPQLSEGVLTPLLYALLNTLGDRELTLKVGGGLGGITIAPSQQNSAHHYLEKIRQDIHALSMKSTNKLFGAY